MSSTASTPLSVTGDIHAKPSNQVPDDQYKWKQFGLMMADCFEESKRQNLELTKEVNEKSDLIDAF